MSEAMMSTPHNFPFILYTEITKISYFSYENVRLALKGKFSSGREGALASKFNYDFK